VTPDGRRRFWLTRDYLPEFADLFAGRPSLTEMARAIGARTELVLIPWTALTASSRLTGVGPRHTWTIMYAGEYRCGPDRPEPEQRAVRRLRDDLVTGRWAERNRDLVALDAAELGLSAARNLNPPRGLSLAYERRASATPRASGSVGSAAVESSRHEETRAKASVDVELVALGSFIPPA